MEIVLKTSCPPFARNWSKALFLNIQLLQKNFKLEWFPFISNLLSLSRHPPSTNSTKLSNLINLTIYFQNCVQYLLSKLDTIGKSFPEENKQTVIESEKIFSFTGKYIE